MRRVSCSVVVLSLVLAFVLAPASAFGWNNGPDGADSFGTHDWVVREANKEAVSDGITWLNLQVAMAASDDPDTIFGDQEYHNYDVTPLGSEGASPEMVEYFYYLAVDSLSRGDSYTASYYVGLLSHYLSDSCDPLHTDGSAGAVEDSMHASYEAAVETQMVPTALGMDTGFRYISDPYELTVERAVSANRFYVSTVYDYISYGLWGNNGVMPSAQLGLWMSSNAVYRVIGSITADAVLDPTPNAIYRFYRPQTGTHFYTASYEEAAKVIACLSNTYSYEGAAYFADPEMNDLPLYRFYNNRSGTHLYTADEGEKDSIIANHSGTFKYEGIAYYVTYDGETEVHRFYSPAKNAHFYSASASEVAYVRANLGSIWQYEGLAYCVAQ